jgi:hypothetical protein
MKKLFMTFLLGAGISCLAHAQDQKTMRKDSMQEWEKKVKTELNLSGDQVTKYDAISKEYRDKMEALRNDASISKEDQKQRKMLLKQEKQARYFEFFTPEQQTKYKDLIDKKPMPRPDGTPQ